MLTPIKGSFVNELHPSTESVTFRPVTFCYLEHVQNLSRELPLATKPETRVQQLQELLKFRVLYGAKWQRGSKDPAKL